MGRASGSNSVLAAAFEVVEGEPPANGYKKMPFVNSNIGAEQPLIDDDLLGQGRNELDADKGIISAGGSITVPVDVRNFGFWLKLAFGAPVSVDSVAAQAILDFSAQPVAASTFTLNGTVWTFVTAAPAGNQVQIGANLGATMTALAAALNGSAETQTAKCTYAAVDSKSLSITYDTLGLTGNAYTVAVTETTNAKVRGEHATLTGGAKTHTWVSGATVLPTAAAEVQYPEVPSFNMNNMLSLNSFSIGLSPSGNLNANLELIGQDEDEKDASQAGVLTSLPVLRFAQAAGDILRNGTALGEVTAATVTFSNNLARVEVIRKDKKIAGVDTGKATFGLDITTRFTDRGLSMVAQNGTASEVKVGWERDRGQSLFFTAHRTILPRAKRNIPGPGGITAQFTTKTALDPVSGKVLTVELTNDVAAY